MFALSLMIVTVISAPTAWTNAAVSNGIRLFCSDKVGSVYYLNNNLKTYKFSNGKSTLFSNIIIRNASSLSCDQTKEGVVYVVHYLQARQITPNALIPFRSFLTPNGYVYKDFNDLGAISTSTMTMDQCRISCYDHGKCKAFSVWSTLDKSTSTCELYSYVPQNDCDNDCGVIPIGNEECNFQPGNYQLDATRNVLYSSYVKRNNFWYGKNYTYVDERVVVSKGDKWTIIQRQSKEKVINECYNFCLKSSCKVFTAWYPTTNNVEDTSVNATCEIYYDLNANLYTSSNENGIIEIGSGFLNISAPLNVASDKTTYVERSLLPKTTALSTTLDFASLSTSDYSGNALFFKKGENNGIIFTNKGVKVSFSFQLNIIPSFVTTTVKDGSDILYLIDIRNVIYRVPLVNGVPQGDPVNINAIKLNSGEKITGISVSPTKDVYVFVGDKVIRYFKDI